MKRFLIGLALTVIYLSTLVVSTIYRVKADPSSYIIISLVSFILGMPALLLSENALNAFEKFFSSWKYKNTEDLELHEWQITLARVGGALFVIMAFTFALILLI